VRLLDHPQVGEADLADQREPQVRDEEARDRVLVEVRGREVEPEAVPGEVPSVRELDGEVEVRAVVGQPGSRGIRDGRPRGRVSA
jgi:hypothetical protein